MNILLGAHVSIAKGLHMAFKRAETQGMTSFQIFTRNPRGWRAKELTKESIQLFHEARRLTGIQQVISHMPYLPNLSSPDSMIQQKSLDSLLIEIDRCKALGIPYLVTHLGHHKGEKEAGWKNLINSLLLAYQHLPESLFLTLENTAGEKNSVGSRFSELATIFSEIEDQVGETKRIALCFDTCHAFGAGYDLSTEEGVGSTIDELKDFDLLSRIKVIHLNDSKAPLGEGKDRHEHIGDGFIGLQGFQAIMSSELVKKKPLILETPVDERKTHVDDLITIRLLLEKRKKDEG